MALELRPNCEFCDVDLPPNSVDAWICSYECTFCSDCVEHKLHNVCPNCGRGFAPRPIRPSTKRSYLSYSLDDIARHSARIRNIPAENR